MPSSGTDHFHQQSSSSGHHHHQHHGSNHLDIVLESPDLVLRGFTGEEFDAAVMKGELVLNLNESTNLKEIQLIFTGT